MRSRKGFELAVSTLVVMILGVLIIAGGIVLITKLTASSTASVDKLTSQQRGELQKFQSEGQLVAISPVNQKAIVGKPVTVAVGITNKLDTDKQFTITVVPSSDDNPKAVLGNADTQFKVTQLGSVSVERNAAGEALIVITPGKRVPPGTYTFLVTATYASTEPVVYDSIRFFTIRVQ